MTFYEQLNRRVHIPNASRLRTTMLPFKVKGGSNLNSGIALIGLRMALCFTRTEPVVHAFGSF